MRFFFPLTGIADVLVDVERRAVDGVSKSESAFDAVERQLERVVEAHAELGREIAELRSMLPAPEEEL